MMKASADSAERLREQADMADAHGQYGHADLFREAADDIEKADRLAAVLREIVEARTDWYDGSGSYVGGETYYGFAKRLQGLARAALGN